MTRKLAPIIPIVLTGMLALAFSTLLVEAEGTIVVDGSLSD